MGSQQDQPSGTAPLSGRGDALLTIDLGAIARNYRTLAAHAAGAETAAVVKADAYGTGMAQVAPLLADIGVRYFFVAQMSEAVALRQLLDVGKRQAEIYVFAGLLPGREKIFAEHKLTPVLNTIDEIDRWAAFGRSHGHVPAAVQIDTGMNRLGLDDPAVKTVKADPQRLEGIELTLVMSHLACADTPEHPLNKRQLERFKAYRTMLPEAKASLANSAGILLGADYHFDMVRPGIGLYGGNPCPAQENPVAPVVSLKAPILQIRSVERGDAIGYGATFTARRRSRIAILSVGYADGLLRALGNRGSLFIQDQAVPIIGRISMDLIAVDITDIPVDRIESAQYVEICGQRTTLDELAQAAGTIAYELLTLLGQRYERRYVGVGDIIEQ